MLPIVLIHGFPLDATMWKHQAEFLTAKGNQVLTPNLPGFGGTPPLPQEQTTMEAFAEHVRHIIVREAGGKAIVGGFSMGGYVLQALLRNHPDCVAAALFIDTRVEQDTHAARDARLKSVDEVQQKGPAGLIETMLGRVMAKKPSPAVKDQVRAIMQKQPPEGIINAQLAMSQRRDQTDLIGSLTIPVLIVVGAEDAVSPPSVALAMQSHMPHAMVVQIVSAGHMAPMEQPGAVNSAIQTFLATVHEPVAAVRA